AVSSGRQQRASDRRANSSDRSYHHLREWSVVFLRRVKVQNPLASDSKIMKNFASSSFRLRDASFEIRLVYSLFLAFIHGGLATTWVFQFQRIGFSYERIVAYYLGGEIQGQMFFPKNLNALLEETHFHTFMMSVVFLILCHLFLASSASRKTKLFFILTTFFSHLFDMGSVWLVRTV